MAQQRRAQTRYKHYTTTSRPARQEPACVYARSNVVETSESSFGDTKESSVNSTKESSFDSTKESSFDSTKEFAFVWPYKQTVGRKLGVFQKRKRQKEIQEKEE